MSRSDALRPSRRGEAPGCTAQAPRARSALRALVRLGWSASPRLLLAVCAAQIAFGVSTPARIILFRKLLEGVSSQHHRSLVVSLLALGLVVAIGGYAQLIQRERGRLLGELVARAGLERVLDAAQSASLVLFDDSTFHDRVQRAQQAQARCSQALIALFAAAGSTLGAVGALFALASVGWFLMPLAILAALPLAMASRHNSDDEYFFVTRLVPLERQRFYLESLLVDRAPAKEIRAFNLAPFIRALHSRLMDDRIEGVRELTKQRMRRMLIGSLLVSTGVVAVAGTLVALYVAGRMSLAVAGAAGYGFATLAGQLKGISRGGVNMYESLLFVAEIDDFVEDISGEQPAVGSPKSLNSDAPPEFTSVTMDQVAFTYPTARRPAVQGVSLHIDAGEMVAFVGPNGSGKTTVAKLLAGLYEPESGRILWGDHDRSTFNMSALRDQVAIGFQDFERFRMSVADNVAVGRYERRHVRDEIVVAAERTGAFNVASSLAEGLDTGLGPEFDGGIDLSQGQWQRIALARVFFRDAKLLILDEPTAALDALAEFELFEAMRRGIAGRSAVLVSHRLATVRMADRIYVFDQGRIAEMGSHRELLDHGGIYAQMYRLQASSYLAEAEGTRRTIRV